MQRKSLAAIARNFYRPSWWRTTGFPAAQNKILATYADAMRWRTVDIMETDWDTLTILDACRYDLFEEHSSFPGRLEPVHSAGSSTNEFLDYNFDSGDTHHDTVYVTANPMYRVGEWVSTSFDNTFHAVVDIWNDEWNEELHTVTPETMAEASLAAAERYPDKRLLLHFIQPHTPFIGPTGREELAGQDNTEIARGRALGEDRDTKENIWDALEKGAVDRETVWQAYSENLDLVLPHVEHLVSAIEGKHIVTADHGNLFGEFTWPFPFKRYGHPENVRTPKLTTVPWQVIETGTRRDVVSEPPDSHQRDEGDTVTARLRDLGYYE